MSIVTRLDQRSVFFVLSFWTMFVSSTVGAVPARGAGNRDSGPMALVEIQPRATHLSHEVASLAGTDDLLDSLHFAWFDRPYARATLAVLVKTSVALQREVRLRDRQSGAISDARVRQMLDWCDQAVDRVRSGSRSISFRPDRLNLSGIERADSFPASSLFGVVDRSTATAIHRQFRDFDLLAAAGLRVYARSAREWATFDVLAKRATGLGIAAIAVNAANAAYPGGDKSNEPLSAELYGTLRELGISVVRPASLRDLIQFSPEAQASEPHATVLARPALGESWPPMIARHALARGISDNGRFVTDGWTLPHGAEPTIDQPSEVSAAMWVAALDGQSLGLIRGWRDLRDGSGSPYPSLLTRPATTEAMFHTALDLIRHEKLVEAFRTSSALAIAINVDAVDARNGNRWATWIRPVWTALVNRQIKFDVLPAGAVARAMGSRYAAILEIDQPSLNRDELLIKIERELAKSGSGRTRTQVVRDDGTLAEEIFVRIGRTPDGKQCIAVANLTDRSQVVRLVGVPIVENLQDVLSHAVISPSLGEIRLSAWQVMILWPR